MEELDENLLSDKDPVFKVAYRMLKHAMRDILYGNCSEEEVTDFIAKINPDKNGYFREDDFLNTDEAMAILHLGRNRVKFFQLMKDNNIVNQKISNMPVGFLKKEIIKLRNKLDEEAKEMNKPKKKYKRIGDHY